VSEGTDIGHLGCSLSTKYMHQRTLLIAMKLIYFFLEFSVNLCASKRIVIIITNYEDKKRNIYPKINSCKLVTPTN
jgi:uncharacterized membrane protein